MQTTERFARIAALKPTRQRVALETPPVRSEDGDRLAQLVGGTVERNRYGQHLLVRRWYAQPEACEASPDALKLLLSPAHGRARTASGSSWPPTAIADTAQWLFLDTETTGLAGGTGTYAFLVGVAWWDSGGLQVEQFFMRDYDEEHAVLEALNQRMAARRVLVTFNGKAFDWPLLEARYTMTRAIRPRVPAAHLDLLHPARQLWRLRLGSVRLAELEKHVLGGDRLAWSRQRDIESWLIPQIYFDYLRGVGSHLDLAGVFQHNQMDLRGLAALTGRVMGLLNDSSAFPCDALELFGLSRMQQRRGQEARAQRLYERAIHAGLPRQLDASARRQLAILARRQGDYDHAARLWQQLLEAGETSPQDLRGLTKAGFSGIQRIEAYEQLAIHFEHRVRKPRRAIEYTRAARLELRRALRLGLVELARGRKLLAQVEHRLARLERKGGQIGRLLERP